MDIIGNPLKYLIYLLIILAIVLLFFKFVDFLNAKKVSTEKQVKEPEKNDKKEESIVNEEVKTSDASNYLFDRFVLSPSKEDDNSNNNKTVFLTDEDYDDIRNRKVDIEVHEPSCVSCNENKSSLYDKIEKMASENVEHKEKLLKEYEGLSREMKLLLIENIMSKYR